MNANTYIKRVARVPSATSSACFTLFVLPVAGGCAGFTREWKFNEDRGCFRGKMEEGGGGEKGVGGLKKLALNENVIPLRGEFVYN